MGRESGAIIDQLACSDPLDADALAVAHEGCFHPAWDRASFQSLLGEDGVVCVGARTGGDDVAGFILCRAAADEAEILTFCVAPEQRRLGIGRSLLEAAVRALKGRGVRRLVLEVGADNEAAIALYRAQGFVECGRRNAYYVQGRRGAVDALIMACPL